MSLQADDLEVGGFVTVLSGRKWKETVSAGGLVQILQREDRSHLGEVLYVAAIDLPYLVVVADPQYGGKPHRCVLDVRVHKLKRLSLEYVSAMRASS